MSEMRFSHSPVYYLLFVCVQENLLVLCMDKHGSRVVDVLWRMSEVSKKEDLAVLLLAHEEELTADFHGSIVLRNCNIAHFRKKQAGWLDQQRAAGRKREIFQDILGEGCHTPTTGVHVGGKRNDDCDGGETVTKKKKKK